MTEQPEGGTLAPGRRPPSPRVRVARSIRAARPHAPPRPPGRSRTWMAKGSESNQRSEWRLQSVERTREAPGLHRGATWPQRRAQRTAVP
eukprot:scaffold30339_cov60-Phaeocystis_antarctica.AAC.1